MTYTKDGLTLTTDSTQPFSLDASNNLSVFTTDSSLVGAHTVTVTVALTNYPTITTTADFLVKIVAVETTMTAAFIPPFTYTIDGAVDDLQFEEFTFTTTDGNEDAYIITYEATLVDSANTDDTDTSSDSVLESDVEYTAATRKFEFSSDEVKTFKLRVIGILTLNGIEVNRADTTFEVTVVEATVIETTEIEETLVPEECQVGFTKAIKEEGFPTFELA